VESIASRILRLRAHRVMLDADLADLYAVRTSMLVQAVKRNRERFPQDFMFQLTEQEVRALKSQSVTLPEMALRYWGRRRRAPYAFSEQGVAMLSSILRSARAIAVNIAIMRAFVKLREMAAANAEFAKTLDELERRVSGHDEAIAGIVRAIRDVAGLHASSIFTPGHAAITCQVIEPARERREDGAWSTGTRDW
jgi:ORF6N domain-containing protein